MAIKIEKTLKHAMVLARHLNVCGLRYAAMAVLLELSVPTKGAGIDYLQNAILMAYSDPVQTFSNGIYQAVGQLYTPRAGEQQVEESIRRVIAEAWRNRDEQVWKFYFPEEADGHVARPSNAEFISRIVRFLELWEGCCKEVRYARKQ